MYTLVDKAPEGKSSGIVLLLAHGAGAPADSPFMTSLAGFLAQEGVTTVRFEFPYMQKRRDDGKKRPPDRQSVLLDSFRGFIEQVPSNVGAVDHLFIGGKSMGGRMATLLAASEKCPRGIRGVACFGYPFHPPGKPEKQRTGHFDQLRCPVFIAQGSRDPFGKYEEFAKGIPNGSRLSVHWLQGGNHDLKPLARQRLHVEALIREAAVEAACFMKEVSVDE